MLYLTSKNADKQVRRGIMEHHVEYESENWFPTFNLGIKMHTLFPLILNGLTEKNLQERNISLLSVFEQILSELCRFTAEVVPVEANYKQLSLISEVMLTSHLPVQLKYIGEEYRGPSQSSSLHIPLHRFLAAVIKHVLVLGMNSAQFCDLENWLDVMGLSKLDEKVKLALLNSPLQCLSMSSQIQSNLWRRNGDENMMTQLYNYCALPYCVNYRDADIFMLQVRGLFRAKYHAYANSIKKIGWSSNDWTRALACTFS